MIVAATMKNIKETKGRVSPQNDETAFPSPVKIGIVKIGMAITNILAGVTLIL